MGGSVGVHPEKPKIVTLSHILEISYRHHIIHITIIVCNIDRYDYLSLCTTMAAWVPDSFYAGDIYIPPVGWGASQCARRRPPTVVGK